MTTRIVLLSVAEPVLVEQDTTEVLDRLNQADPLLVAPTRPGGRTVHLSRAAVALVEDAGDLTAEAALTTTATSGASTVRDEVGAQSLARAMSDSPGQRTSPGRAISTPIWRRSIPAAPNATTATQSRC